MNERPDRTTPSSATGSGRGFWLALALVVVVVSLVAVLLGWYFNRSREVGVAPAVAVAARDSVPAPATRGAILVFPSAGGRGHVTEQRQLPAADLPEQEIAAVLEALAAGPRRTDAAAVLPRGSRVRAVFLDAGGTEVVVDWSGDLLAGIEGGSTWEAAILDTILRTLALDFPRLRRCTLLVEGAPVTTLAGHLALDRPFDLAAWR